MAKNFPEHYRHIRELMGDLSKGIPNTMGSFSKLHEKATETGTLDVQTKELIALGIAIAIRCDGCIAFHVHDALQAGASDEAIMETIGVAVLMGGGPAVMYGCEAYEAMRQFQAERVAQDNGQGKNGQ
jgi:AhpD family alkylhydroperoxidase